MRGNLALDTVVMWIILLVAAGVVIGIIFHYSSEIKRIFPGPTEKNISETERIKADSFSESQVKTFIKLCWEKTGEDFNKDFICYILEGNLTNINPDDLKGDYGNYYVVSNFNNTKGILIIRFEDIGNKIILEN